MFISNHCEGKGEETELARGKSQVVVPPALLAGSSGARITHQGCRLLG